MTMTILESPMTISYGCEDSTGEMLGMQIGVVCDGRDRCAGLSPEDCLFC